jgi:hypothetical protein
MSPCVNAVSATGAPTITRPNRFAYALPLDELHGDEASAANFLGIAPDPQADLPR